MGKTNLTVSFLIKPSEANKDGLAPIYCRFKVGKDAKKEISLNMRVKEEDWNSESQSLLTVKGMTKSQRELVGHYNQAIADMRNSLWENYNRLKALHGNVTSQQLKDAVQSKNDYTFGDAMCEVLKDYTRLTNYTNNASLQKATVICQRFQKFLQEDIGTEHLLALQNRTDLSELFHDYCIKVLKHKGSYLKKMWAYIRRCFSVAKRKGWISVSIPFEYKFYDTAYALKEYLTKEELLLIVNAKFDTASLQQYADVFVFQCLTGLSYADLKKVRHSDIQEQNGEYFLRDLRQKSKVEYNIPLLPMAVEIIKKYKQDSNSNDLALPMKSNANYNIRLKTIMDVCKIDKSISSHCARYTCNMLLFEAGVSDEVRKHILGHTTVAMTHHYTFKRTTVLSDAMNKMGKNLFE